MEVSSCDLSNWLGFAARARVPQSAEARVTAGSRSGVCPDSALDQPGCRGGCPALGAHSAFRGLVVLGEHGQGGGAPPAGQRGQLSSVFPSDGRSLAPPGSCSEDELCCKLLPLTVPPGPPLRKSGLKALGGGEDEASLLLGLRPCGIMQHGQQGLKVVLTEGCFGGSRRLLLPQTPTQARLSVFLHLCG